jgi:hypothetical protein
MNLRQVLVFKEGCATAAVLGGLAICAACGLYGQVVQVLPQMRAAVEAISPS